MGGGRCGRKVYDVMKRMISILLLCVWLVSLGAANAENRKKLPSPAPVRTKAVDHDKTETITIRSDKDEVYLNETFHLSWNLPNAENCALWVSHDYQGFVWLGDFDPVMRSYALSEPDIGDYGFVLMIYENGQWSQSNTCTVKVYADDDTTCEILKKRGMTNTWNLLFIVYRTVRIGNYERSFTDEQIASIKQTASEMKTTLETLSDSRMMIGSVDLILEEKPITSASYTDFSPPALTYGPDGDVDFNYVVDHKDITLVAVAAPLLGLNNQGEWLGLGGTFITVHDKPLYTIIVNEIYTSGSRTEYDGKSYMQDSAAIVHEMLHCVETNSESIGWSGFESLHNKEIDGYPDNDYEWFQDIMRDTIKGGKRGFLKQSYYVSHRKIASGMSSGVHEDYDGAVRYYLNGVPHPIDMILPSSITDIEDEAFWNVQAKYFLLPDSVQSIGWHAFSPGTTLYGKKGCCAETWAQENNCVFFRMK